MDLSLLAAAASAGSLLLGMTRYRATNPENLNRHPIRKRILQLLRLRPGLNISRLCNETGAKWGAMQYHLYLLERSGLVESTASARDRNFFPSDLSPEHVRRLAVLRRGRVEAVARAILQGPGNSAAGLSRQTAAARRVVRHYLELMAREGLVEARSGAARKTWYPTPLLANYLGAGEAPEAPSDGPEGPSMPLGPG